MKYGVLVFLLALAACGGGGSSGGGSPIPQPTQQPTLAPTAYTLSIHYTGGAAPRGGLTWTRKPMSVTTPPPVMLVAADSPGNPALEFSVGSAGDQSAAVSVTVNPSPSPTPSVAQWSGGNSVVSVAPAGQYQASVAVTTANQTSTGGTINVTVPAPVNSSATVPVTVYPRVIVDCPTMDHSSDGSASEWVGGVSFDSTGRLVNQTDPALSDLYVSGPTCIGKFNNPAESGPTLHFPYGGHLYADGYKSFNLVVATDLQTDLHSKDIQAMQTGLLDTAVFKDALGDTVKVYFRQLATFDRNSGPYQVCGHTIDGSC